MCMIRLGLGGVLVVCEDFYNLDRSVLSPPPPFYFFFLKLQPLNVHTFSFSRNELACLAMETIFLVTLV